MPGTTGVQLLRRLGGWSIHAQRSGVDAVIVVESLSTLPFPMKRYELAVDRGAAGARAGIPSLPRSRRSERRARQVSSRPSVDVLAVHVVVDGEVRHTAFDSNAGAMTVRSRP
jgi:hypothetical protein